MDGLEIQSQHESEIVAPFRKEEKGNLKIAAGWLEL